MEDSRDRRREGALLEGREGRNEAPPKPFNEATPRDPAERKVSTHYFHFFFSVISFPSTTFLTSFSSSTVAITSRYPAAFLSPYFLARTGNTER